MRRPPLPEFRWAIGSAILRRKKDKATAGQVLTVAKQRLVDKAGTITTAEMSHVERALRVQLGLD